MALAEVSSLFEAARVNTPSHVTGSPSHVIRCLLSSAADLEPACPLVDHQRSTLLRVPLLQTKTGVVLETAGGGGCQQRPRLTLQRGRCLNGPHDLGVAYGQRARDQLTNQDLFPHHARFDALELQSGLTLRLDEWLILTGQKSTTLDRDPAHQKFQLPRETVSRLLQQLTSFTGFVGKPESLCPILAADISQPISSSSLRASGKAWPQLTDWTYVRLVSRQPRGVSLTSLALGGLRSGTVSAVRWQASGEEAADRRQPADCLPNLSWLRHVTGQILLALAWLHEHSMAHRRLRLTNTYVTETGQVTLCDYEYFTKLTDLIAVSMQQITGGDSDAAAAAENQQVGLRILHHRDICQLSACILSLVAGGEPQLDRLLFPNPTDTHANQETVLLENRTVARLLTQLDASCPKLTDFLRVCLSGRHEWSAKRLAGHQFLMDHINHIESRPETGQSNTLPNPPIGSKRPRLLTDFQGLSVIGRGGFGCVLKARNILEDREYAIKCVKIEDSQVDVLFREIRTLSALQHDNIVRYFTSWQDTFPNSLPLSDMPWAESAVGLLQSGNQAFSSSAQSQSQSPSSDSRESSPLASARPREGKGRGKANTARSKKKLAGGRWLSPKLTPVLSGDEDSWCQFGADHTASFRPSRRFFIGGAESSSSQSSDCNQDGVNGLDDASDDASASDFEKSSKSREFMSSDGEQTSDSSASDAGEGRRQKSRKYSYLIIQMELCASKDLRHVIEAESLHTSPDRAWSIFRELTDGLAYIHSKNVIHRDLKPANIMLSAGDHVKIVDFGLATRTVQLKQVDSARRDAMSVQKCAADFIGLKSAHETSPQKPSGNTPADRSTELPGDLPCGEGYLDRNKLMLPQQQQSMTRDIGTFLYISPEIMAGRGKHLVYDERVDIYSLGVILFEMFYRPMPVVMERVAVLTELRREHIVFPRDWLTKRLINQTRLIRSMLQHDPCCRPSASDLLSSPCVPPLKSTEAAFRKQLAEACQDPESHMYRFVTRTLFSQSCSRTMDVLYDCNLIDTEGFGARLRLTQGEDDSPQTLQLAYREQRLFRQLSHHIESVFLLHNGVHLQPPTLLPVVRSSTTTSSSRSSNAVTDSQEHVTVGLRDTGSAPIFLDAHGAPVCLPDSLHVAFARHLARRGGPLLSESVLGNRGGCALRRYQFGRVYSLPTADGGTSGKQQVYRHPVEAEQAVFNVVTPGYSPHALVELWQVLREIVHYTAPLNKANQSLQSQTTSFTLYANHTELTEALFLQLGLGHPSESALWHHLTESNRCPGALASSSESPNLRRPLQLPFFTSAGGRPPQAYRQFLHLLQLAVSRPEAIRVALDQCANRRVKAPLVIRRRVDAAIRVLEELSGLYERVKEDGELSQQSRLQLYFTPGLVLPRHLYCGVVFQLVAHVQSPTSRVPPPVVPQQIRSRGDGEDKVKVKSRHPPSSTCPEVVVLAQGGDFSHLVLRHCLPEEYSSLRFPTKTSNGKSLMGVNSTCLDTEPDRQLPILFNISEAQCPSTVGLAVWLAALASLHRDSLRLGDPRALTWAPLPALSPQHCQVLVSWECRTTDSLHDLCTTPFRQFSNHPPRRGQAQHHLQQRTVSICESGLPPPTTPGVGLAGQSGCCPPALPTPSSSTMGPVSTPTTLNDSLPCVPAGLTSSSTPTTTMAFASTVFGSMLDAYVPTSDGLLLAQHLLQKLRAAGMPCELVSPTNSDIIRLAEDRLIAYAVRVSLLTASESASGNLPPATHCLSAVTYQLWTLQQSAHSSSQSVMICETRRGSPDALIAYLISHRLSTAGCSTAPTACQASSSSGQQQRRFSPADMFEAALSPWGSGAGDFGDLGGGPHDVASRVDQLVHYSRALLPATNQIEAAGSSLVLYCPKGAAPGANGGTLAAGGGNPAAMPWLDLSDSESRRSNTTSKRKFRRQR